MATLRSMSGREFPAAWSALGGYQLLGGGAGVLLMLWAVVGHPNAVPLHSLLLSLAPFSLVVGAGLASYRRDLSKALILTVAGQVLQVLWISIPAFTWKFSAGVHLVAVFSPTATRLAAGADVALLTGRDDQSDLLAVGVNFIPLVVVAGTLYLWYQARRTDSLKVQR